MIFFQTLDNKHVDIKCFRIGYLVLSLDKKDALIITLSLIVPGINISKNLCNRTI